MASIILPGFIDPHVHLRDPGQTSKEDFYSGTCAAIAGGYTSIIDMPNNKTPITTKVRLEEKIKKAKEKTVCDIGFYFGSLGDNLDEFKHIAQKAMGLKLYLNETTGNFLINKEKLSQMFNAWPTNGGPILLHAEDDAVEWVIREVRKTKKKTHFCHISTKSDLKQIIAAKEKKLPITCGVTPHHLFLTDKDAKRLGSFGKMKPPLRPSQDVDFLWKHLNAIDVIETDHAPHTKSEKESNMAPYGVPGLETTLPLLITALTQEKITLEDIARLCFENASKIFNIPIDQDTNIEIDTDTMYQIKGDSLFTKCKWTPFEGMQVRGKVVSVQIRNKKVFDGKKILVKRGFGKIIRPKA